jgi:dTDP-4-dehydrorhamnose 3,5-epimerase
VTIEKTPLEGVLLIQPRRFEDDRGYFYESYNRDRYGGLGLDIDFVQDNVSLSRRGVLRGLHFQHPTAQSKLVSVLAGEVYDVVVDIRPDSPTFGRSFGTVLSERSGRQMFIPEGFAHGFVALSEQAVFAYKCSRYYHPEDEYTIRWDDGELAIEWPVAEPLVSPKDADGRSFGEIRSLLGL